MRHMVSFRSLKWLLALVVTTSATPAMAGVIDFTGFSDFSNYSQAGMNMTSSSVWNWPGSNMAHMDGGTATFVLGTGGDFNLNSVDMLANGGGGPARFSAYNNGSLLGFVDIPGNAGTFNFGPLFSNIDEFRVTVPSNHFTFDNVRFTEAAVPEPMSMALFGGLVAVGGLVARRRMAKAAA